MKIINLMPIDITYANPNGLERWITFPTSGYIARLRERNKTMISIVYQSTQIDICQQSPLYTEYILPIGMEDVEGNQISLYGHCADIMYDLHGEDVLFIINNVVAQVIKREWHNRFISPATGNDGVIREDGKIIAVTKFNQFV